MTKLVVLLCIFLSGCASWWQKDKTKADLYLRMGISEIEAGNYPAALRSLLKAEELDSKNPATQNNLGLVYFQRERLDLAEKHVRRAVELDSRFSEARNNLARIYIEKGDLLAAEKELKTVLNDLTYANPEKAYVNLGLVKFNSKNFTEARKTFGKVLQINPDDCVANTYVGRSLFELGDYSTAAEALDRAIGFCQKNLFDEPHYFSALTYFRLGEKAKSMARFEELVKLYPNGQYREKAKGMLSLIRKGL
jgi:type IV pilus assembly protein PilF